LVELAPVPEELVPIHSPVCLQEAKILLLHSNKVPTLVRHQTHKMLQAPFPTYLAVLVHKADKPTHSPRQLKG
jgi:hypothetical protein